MSTGDPVGDGEGTSGQRDDLLDVGEEVARLTETLAGWWTSVTAGAAASRGSAGPDGADDHSGGDGARDDAAGRPGPDHGGAHSHHEAAAGESCRVCPLCRVLDMARAARPDLLTQLATAAETVALLLREAAAGDRARGPSAGPATAGTDVDGVAPSGAGPRPRGTPIVVRDSGETSIEQDVQQERGTPWG